MLLPGNRSGYMGLVGLGTSHFVFRKGYAEKRLNCAAALLPSFQHLSGL